MRKILLQLIIFLCVFAVGFFSINEAKADDNASISSKKEKTVVKLETTLGDIYIELNEEKAPESVANFKRYVEEGFYEGTIFHRVIDGFMIQGGGMTVDLNSKATHDSIKNEADNGLKNVRYSVAMARTQDPDSATSQFYINIKDNTFLDYRGKNVTDWGYCVFGMVVSGTSVVDKIRTVPTRRSGFHEDVPTIPVVIKKASIETK